MFSIKVDNNLLAYLGEQRIRIDELVIIVCFVFDRLDLVKIYLQGKSGDQCSACLQSLVRKGLMRRLCEIEDFDWDNYELTEGANNVYEDCISNILWDVPVIRTTQDLVTMTQGSDDIDVLIASFLLLWPDGVRNLSGELLKNEKKDVKKRMEAFIKKYKFDKDTILKATENFLSKQRAQGYTYCSQSHYFIMKDGVSKLAAECEDAKRNIGSTNAWENVM